ncbi:MAG: phospholipase D family protein [Saprospiraceae bacterium]|nr:phospholipase D family protein [Saprospiraceae bacterium]
MQKLVHVCVCVYTIFIISACKQNPSMGNATNDYCSGVPHLDSTHIQDHLQTIDTLLINKSGAYVLEDGDGSMIARAWLTEHAQKTIDIQYFIFSVDNVGLIACDYLVRAADKGVKIRIRVDDVMVEAEPDDIMVMDAHPNIEIKIYNPGTNLGKNLLQKAAKVVTDWRGINQRMHNKTFIADGISVITGGRNIADEYFDYDHEYNFRDRDIFLIGDICQEIQQSFELFWNHTLSVSVRTLISDQKPEYSQTSRYDKLHKYACDSNNYWPQVRARVKNIPKAFYDIVHSGDLIFTDSISFISDDPGKNANVHSLEGSGKTTEQLISLIKSAKKSIDIQTPYLVTTDLSRLLFKSAVDRGVKIRILTNSLASTDNLEAFSGYQRDREALLLTGVRIFEFRPDAACRYQLMTGALQKKLDFTPTFGLHAKSMVIDNNITVIGTFNLDPRSAHLNTECITVIHSRNLAEGVLKGMNEEFLPVNSWETTSEWNPDGKVSIKKRISTRLRKVVPKSVL